jgi:hypothetical protein
MSMSGLGPREEEGTNLPLLKEARETGWAFFFLGTLVVAAVARSGKSEEGTGGGGGGRSSCSSAARAHEPGLAQAEATAMSSGVCGALW